MSGLLASRRHQNSSRLAYKLWKLTSTVRKLLMVLMRKPSGLVGDDVARGELGWMELVELQLEREVLVDVSESLLMKVSNRLVEIFGIPHL